MVDFGLLAFDANLFIDGSGPRRWHADAVVEQAEKEPVPEAAMPSPFFLDDFIVPKNAGNLEKMAFFAVNQDNPASFLLGYVSLNPDSRFIGDLNPGHLVHKPVEFPTQIYAAYALPQNDSAYDNQANYEPELNPAIPYQVHQTDTKPYSFPLLKPEEFSMPKFTYEQSNFAPNYDIPKQAIEVLSNNFWQTVPSFNGVYKPAQTILYARPSHAIHNLENLVAKPSIKFSHTIQPQQFLPQPLTPRSYRVGVDRIVNSFFAESPLPQIVPGYPIPVTSNVSGTQNKIYHQQTSDISNITMKTSNPDSQKYTSESYGHKNSEDQNSGQKNYQASGSNTPKPIQNSQDSKNSNVIYLRNRRQPRRDNTALDWQPKKPKRKYKASGGQSPRLRDTLRKGIYYLPALKEDGNSGIDMNQRSNEHQDQTLERQNEHPTSNYNNAANQSIENSNASASSNVAHLADYRNSRRLDLKQGDMDKYYNSIFRLSHKKLKDFARKSGNNLVSFVRSTYTKLKNQTIFREFPYSDVKTLFSKVKTVSKVSDPNMGDAADYKPAAATITPSHTTKTAPETPEISDKLQGSAQYLKREYGCDVAYVIIDVKSGETIASMDADKSVSMASMSKIVLVRAILDLAQQGRINLEDKVKIRNSLKPKNFGAGEENATYLEIINEVVSNKRRRSNGYANILIDVLGLMRANKMAKGYGYTGTSFADYFLPQANYREDKSTMNDMGRAMHDAITGKGLDEKHHKLFLNAMNVKGNAYIVCDPNNLDGFDIDSFMIKHAQSEHDAGILVRVKGVKDGKEYDTIIGYNASNLKQRTVQGDFVKATSFGRRFVGDFLGITKQFVSYFNVPETAPNRKIA